MLKGYTRIGEAGLLSILAVVLASSAIDAFSPIDRRTSCVIRKSSRSSTCRLTELHMGKGFNSAKNKQAELARKMAIAKKQSAINNGQDDSSAGTGEDPSQTEEERKLEEDRARFAQMLRDSKVTNPNPFEKSDEIENRPMRLRVAARIETPKGRKTSKAVKRRKESAATPKGEEDDVNVPLREGDIARRGDFETLFCCDSGGPVGPIDAARLVPWVPPFVADYIVILADPRAQSHDLRRTVQYLTSNLAPDVLRHTIAINSDEVTETEAWIHRAEIDTPMRIFSDRNWAWMRRYSAVVGNGRWSMSITVIDNAGVIRDVVRDVDPSKASQLVAAAIELIK